MHRAVHGFLNSHAIFKKYACTLKHHGVFLAQEGNFQLLHFFNTPSWPICHVILSGGSVSTMWGP